MDIFRAASARLEIASKRHLAGEITDDEYLLARDELDAIDKLTDALESRVVAEAEDGDA